jgi:hypothetical protein
MSPDMLSGFLLGALAVLLLQRARARRRTA